MSGKFEINGLEYEVNAEGRVKKYTSKKIGKILIGDLDGTIVNDNEEREVDIAVEKTANNLYYAITIYSDVDREEEEKGNLKESAVIIFGEPKADEKILKEIGEMKDSNDSNKDRMEEKQKIEKKELENIDYMHSENIQDMASANYIPGGFNNMIRSSWEELDYEGAELLVLLTNIWLDDNLYYDGDDGRMMIKVSADFHDAEEDMEDLLDIRTVKAYGVNEIYCRVESLDINSGNSTIQGRSPIEDDSDDDVFSNILKIFNLMPEIPGNLITIIELIGDNIGNDINTTYENSDTKMLWRIYPEDSTYLDWYEYSEGGYPFTISFNKNKRSTDDDWEIKTEAELRFYNSDDGFYFNQDTVREYIAIDLSNY
ncbi:MAG: hypothetical protein AAGU27_21460 [Dehalobacterium sp.]